MKRNLDIILMSVLTLTMSGEISATRLPAKAPGSHVGDEYVLFGKSMFDKENNLNLFTQGGKPVSYPVWIDFTNPQNVSVDNLIDVRYLNGKPAEATFNEGTSELTIATPHEFESGNGLQLIGTNGSRDIVLVGGNPYGIGYFEYADNIVFNVTAAQVNRQMKLSYCKGKVASSRDIGMTGAGIVEAASYIPSSMVSNYRDLKVVGIKADLSSKLNVETLTVWVRESLDGENLCECTISKAGGDEIRKGWNYLIPASPYSAGRNTGFYVGYTIKQKGTSYPVSVVGNDHDGGLYVKANNAWTDRCKEGKGTLSIEAIIEASNLPTFDLALNDVALPYRIKGGSEATGTLSISNEASMTVSGFDIVYDIEGMQPQTVTISRELPPCTEDTVTFNFTPALDGRKRALPMSVSIARLEEGEDVDNSNNTFNTRFDLVKHDFVKVPVMEEFTTEPCSNCLRAAEIVHAVLDDERYGGGKVAAVCHHSGFQTDWLTNDADREYVWFYGGSSFAPAIMFDRSASEGSSPVRGVSGAEDMMKTLDDIMSVPASVALECRAVYDKSKNCVVVNVEGSHDWDFNIEEPRITLYLLENNIPARRQAGASDDYLQQHVVRAYNDTWGEPYEVNEDGDFSYSREVGIDDSWVRDNMEVVAFVGSYDPDAYWNCGIENAAVCKIDWSSSQVGVENMETDSILMTEWFTIDGIPAVSPQRHCLYMRVDYFSNGSKKTSKVYIP